MMMYAFITIRFLDILDILLVAFFLYQIYLWIKGTVAINIFVGIFAVYLLWLIVKALNMQLLSTILGQFMGVGVLVLIIVFQQEIRRFLLLIGSHYKFNTKLAVEKLFSPEMKAGTDFITPIAVAVKSMAATYTGALIVIERNSPLKNYSETGNRLNAIISKDLIESIFYPNSPLHDGAIIIAGNKIKAARCILPVTDNPDFDSKLGLRHRAAVGMSETTDAFVIIVSEETGKISFADDGTLTQGINADDLVEIIKEKL